MLGRLRHATACDAFSVFRIPGATRPKQFLLSCWIDAIAARFPSTAGGAGTGLSDVRASSTRANDSLSHDLGIDRAGGKLAKIAIQVCATRQVGGEIDHKNEPRAGYALGVLQVVASTYMLSGRRRGVGGRDAVRIERTRSEVGSETAAHNAAIAGV
jgi:hypothetical protein